MHLISEVLCFISSIRDGGEKKIEDEIYLNSSFCV